MTCRRIVLTEVDDTHALGRALGAVLRHGDLVVLTGGLGADVAIEAVGVPATFELATRLIRPGGHVANIGVHGEAATLHLEDLWSRNVTITTGLVDTYSTPTLLELVRTQQLDATRLVTHHFQLDEMMAAYDTFADAATTGSRAARQLQPERSGHPRPLRKELHRQRGDQAVTDRLHRELDVDASAAPGSCGRSRAHRRRRAHLHRRR